MRYFEDVQIGDHAELGSYTFTAEEIARFGRKFDRQVFHTDEEKAKDTPFGGLIASGWHTAAIFMKLFVRWVGETTRKHEDEPADIVHAGASPGFEDLRWPRPVRAGDTVTFHTRVISKREMKSRPGFGLVYSRAEGFNQNGELVYAFTGKGIVPRKSE